MLITNVSEENSLLARRNFDAACNANLQLDCYKIFAVDEEPTAAGLI